MAPKPLLVIRKGHYIGTLFEMFWQEILNIKEVLLAWGLQRHWFGLL